MDYAKGICIVAVVMLYATDDLRREMLRLGQDPGHSWFDAIVDFMRPFRMPDFFLLSGLFLSRVIDRPWRTYLDKRVLHYLYFFMLWTLIFFGFRTLMGGTGDGPGAALQTLWTMVVHPFAMLWFLQMLAIYFLFTRLTRRIPKLLVFAFAAVLQVVGIWSEYVQIRQFAERFVFFFAGYAFAPMFFALAAAAARHQLRAVAGLLAWALFNGTMVVQGLTHAPGMELVLGLAGAAAVVVTASLLCEFSWTDWLRYLGEHSIVVYLGFYLPMSAATILAPRLGWADEPGLAAALITVFSTVCAVALHHYTRHNAGRYLFVRPRWACLEATPEPMPAARPAEHRTAV